MSYELDVSRPQHRRDVSVIAFHRADSESTLRGFVDVHVVPWHFRILGCPAHSQGDRRWIKLPGKPLTDRNGDPLIDASTGKKRWAAFAAFDDKDLLDRFSHDACAALDAYSAGWSR